MPPNHNSKMVLSIVKIGPTKLDKIENLRSEIRFGTLAEMLLESRSLSRRSRRAHATTSWEGARTGCCS